MLSLSSELGFETYGGGAMINDLIFGLYFDRMYFGSMGWIFSMRYSIGPKLRHLMLPNTKDEYIHIFCLTDYSLFLLFSSHFWTNYRTLFPDSRRGGKDLGTGPSSQQRLLYNWMIHTQPFQYQSWCDYLWMMKGLDGMKHGKWQQSQ